MVNVNDLNIPITTFWFLTAIACVMNKTHDVCITQIFIFSSLRDLKSVKYKKNNIQTGKIFSYFIY